MIKYREYLVEDKRLIFYLDIYEMDSQHMHGAIQMRDGVRYYVLIDTPRMVCRNN